jgi:hypothetical protein
MQHFIAGRCRPDEPLCLEDAEEPLAGFFQATPTPWAPTPSTRPLIPRQRVPPVPWCPISARSPSRLLQENNLADIIRNTFIHAVASQTPSPGARCRARSVPKDAGRDADDASESTRSSLSGHEDYSALLSSNCDCALDDSISTVHSDDRKPQPRVLFCQDEPLCLEEAGLISDSDDSVAEVMAPVRQLETTTPACPTPSPALCVPPTPEPTASFYQCDWPAAVKMMPQYSFVPVQQYCNVVCPIIGVNLGYQNVLRISDHI